MKSRGSFLARRLAVNLGQPGGGALTLTVRWEHRHGGEPDPTTGALTGGLVVSASGTLRGFVHEEPARSVLRQMAEIQAGDLIVDVAPDPVVAVAANLTLSGVTNHQVLLEDVRLMGVRFEHNGQLYSQKNLGRELAKAWDTTIEDGEGKKVKLDRTLLLRRET